MPDGKQFINQNVSDDVTETAEAASNVAGTASLLLNEACPIHDPEIEYDLEPANSDDALKALARGKESVEMTVGAVGVVGVVEGVLPPPQEASKVITQQAMNVDLKILIYRTPI
jgi:hypothetical protein